MKRYILVQGGNFLNKGAQSMSFITINILKKEFPDHEILFCSPLDYNRNDIDINNYTFRIIDNPLDKDASLLENILRKILKKNSRTKTKEEKLFKEEVLNNTDYVFDISGYTLSSQFGVATSLKYLRRQKKAQKYNMKSYILPQSLGPFDYGVGISWIMRSRVKKILSEVDHIFVRENDGYKQLTRELKLNNVTKSLDLVLLNRETIDFSNIYISKPEEKRYSIKNSSVAIIPNMKNFKHGNKEEIVEAYVETINEMLLNNKNVYLIRHSFEDIEACKLIKERFPNDEKVQLLTDDLTPNEFENLIKQFDFAIASRFHSIIHAYKVNVPCLLLGWATKYHELASSFDQEEFVFDVRDRINGNKLTELAKQLDANLTNQRELIQKTQEELNKLETPFELILNDIKTSK